MLLQMRLVYPQGTPHRMMEPLGSCTCIIVRMGLPEGLAEERCQGVDRMA